MRMKKFRVGDIFSQERGKEKAPNQVPPGNVPMINETSENNGFTKLCSPSKIFKGNCLTISINYATTVFYQDKDFAASVNIAILRNDNFNEKSYLYVAGLLKRAHQIYDYNHKISKDRLNDEVICLPIKNVISPDYDLIENLIGGGIDMSKIDTSDWRKFKLTDIFDIEGSKTTPKAELYLSSNAKYPYVTTQSTNNGIAGYSDKWTEQGGCLTVDSAVLGTVFYQAENFTASDHVEKLIPKFEMSEKMALWFQTILQKNAAELGYSYQKKRSQKALAEETILLPYKETEEIDFEYMENYISELEAERISELEAERISELEAYLAVTGLDDYELTEEDIEVLNRYRTEVEVVA